MNSIETEKNIIVLCDMSAMGVLVAVMRRIKTPWGQQRGPLARQ